jgi:hypothetical protein
MPTQIVLPQSVKLPTWFILAASILRSIFTVLPRPGTTTLVEINTSLSAMHSQARFKRLLREDDGVEGCGLFRATPEEVTNSFLKVERLTDSNYRSGSIHWGMFYALSSLSYDRPLTCYPHMGPRKLTTTCGQAGSWTSRYYLTPSFPPPGAGAEDNTK